MHASDAFGLNLQAVLVDLIELQLQGKQAHWNVVGQSFRGVHLHVDDIVDTARTYVDDVAERMRALHLVPDGRASTVADTTRLHPYPLGEQTTSTTVELITARVEAVVATVRGVRNDVDTEDPTTTDILHAIIADLEKMAWLLEAENRVPSAVTESVVI